VSRRQFDEEQVLDLALGLLDEGGPVALSVRSLAAALGVRPNAVYTYVADKAALEAAVAERVLGQADLGLLDGPPARWRSRLERFSLSVRTVLLDHPGAVPLLMSMPLNGPVALAIGEGILGAFRDAGLSTRDATRATYAVIVHVLGSVALDVAETDGTRPLPPEAERIAERAAAFAAVPSEAFPLTAAARTTMATWVGEEQFLWGLRALLDGAAGR
jgi:TetR/AcrR family transcriptional regulator, tetracycline repressor protein